MDCLTHNLYRLLKPILISLPSFSSYYFSYFSTNATIVDAEIEEIQDFIKEIDIMKKIGVHPNVIRFLGVVSRKLMQARITLIFYNSLTFITFLVTEFRSKQNPTFIL